jgi:hypothetical protein
VDDLALDAARHREILAYPHTLHRELNGVPWRAGMPVGWRRWPMASGAARRRSASTRMTSLCISLQEDAGTQNLSWAAARAADLTREFSRVRAALEAVLQYSQPPDV